MFTGPLCGSRQVPGRLYQYYLAVADEGPYAGRRIFMDLPDVNAQPWVAKVVAKMVNSLGVEFPRTLTLLLNLIAGSKRAFQAHCRCYN